MSLNITSTKLFQKLYELEQSNPKISLNIQNEAIKVAEKILSNIPQFMPEYTLHDINHCINILNIIGEILPNEVELNIVELQILIYAILFHDIGMVINQEEALKLKTSSEFTKITLEFENSISEDEILTELIRRTHVKRSLEYIDKFKNDFSTYKIDFTFNSIDISQWIKNVIESHELPVSKLTDTAKYPLSTIIDSFNVNVQYLAILLRLGDILDFDITRTPYFLFKHIGLKNNISVEEWQKHQAIQGRTYNSTEIRFEAKPKTIQSHRKIESFIEWIEIERKESMKLLESNSNKDKYFLELSKEVYINIQPDGYEYTKLEINFDYEKVLNILMGTELYDNVDIFLRELIQNSYDACKYYKDKYEKIKDEFSAEYDPKIIINYNSSEKTLEIRDNGIGIDEDTFRNYVIKIGQSFYKSKYFSREECGFQPISNFGIGILSCFMVSDSIEIESFKEGYLPIHYVMDISNKYITKLTTSFNTHGTRIKLKLHDDFLEKLENKSIDKIIETNMTNYQIPILLKQNGIEDKKFENQDIIIPKHFSELDGLILIPFDKDADELEGYVVLHKKQGMHQYLDENKLAQQNFVITNKKNQIPLQPLWIQNIRYKINIPNVKKLSLKASRNSVKDDEGLLILKEKIAQKIIDYFEENQKIYKRNFLNMYHHLGDGRGNAIRFQNEFDFLVNIQMFSLITTLKQDGQKFEYSNEFSSFSNFYQKLPQDLQIKVAVIKEAYLNNHSNLQILIPYFYNNDYKFIVVDNFISINYFYQFIEPLTIQNEVYISDLEGLAYQSVVLEKKEALNVKDYSQKYSWTDINKNINDRYFTVVSNNHYNGFDIVLINDKHALGKLIYENINEYCIKGFKNSVVNNFSNIYLGKKQKLESFEWLPEENHFIFEANNLEAYASKFKRCLTDSFLKSMNDILENKVLNTLIDESIIKDEDKVNFMLSKYDFPEWYHI